MKRKSKKATETATESSAPSAPTVETTEASAPIVVGPSGPMEFSVKRKELAAHVRRLASIAEKKARGVMPILSHVLIRAGGDGVVLAATDLNTYGVVHAATWTVTGGGSVALPVKELGEVLRKLPDGEITLRAIENGVRISCAGVEVRLSGEHARDYPKLPAVLPTDRGYGALEIATVDADTMREMIRAVLHAVCQDQTRFHMNGVYFEYDGGVARMVATDGHRLAKVERDMPRAGDFYIAQGKGLIIPEKGAEAFQSLLAKSGTCDIGMVSGMLICRQTVLGAASGEYIAASSEPRTSIGDNSDDLRGLPLCLSYDLSGLSSSENASVIRSCEIPRMASIRYFGLTPC